MNGSIGQKNGVALKLLNNVVLLIGVHCFSGVNVLAKVISYHLFVVVVFWGLLGEGEWGQQFK